MDQRSLFTIASLCCLEVNKHLPHGQQLPPSQPLSPTPHRKGRGRGRGRGQDTGLGAEVSHVLSRDSETSKGSPGHSVESEWKFSSSSKRFDPESEAHESSVAMGSLTVE